jgi:hypothetical protein
VQKPGQAPQPKRQVNRETAYWVCLIASLTFCLWGSNALQIQRLEYRLTTNIAISQHRFPLLQRLSNNVNKSGTLSSTVFSRLEILPDDASRSASNSSDLKSVRVNILCKNHCDFRVVEQVLNELTTPTEESAECVVFEKQILKERWLMESNRHSMKRLEMDVDRERIAIESDRDEAEGIASKEVEESQTVSPFRLTAFGVGQTSTTPHSGLPHSGLMDGLHHLNQLRTENIESMLQTMKRLHEKSKGFLSFTGSPRMDPIVKPITLFRFVVLSVLCVLVWLLLMAWLQPIRGSISLLRNWLPPKQFRLKSKRDEMAPKASTHSSTLASSEITKTLHWLQRSGIPYLGTIQVAVGAETTTEFGSQSLAINAMNQETTPTNDLVAESAYSGQARSIRMLKRLSECSLVFWIGLLVFRLIFDPLWRELVLVAPLAALSRMISGIQ